MIATLRRLLAEGTPGPWRVKPSRVKRSGNATDTVVRGRSFYRSGSPTAPIQEDPAGKGVAVTDADGKDAALIVAAVSALPALLDVVELADKVVRKPGANR